MNFRDMDNLVGPEGCAHEGFRSTAYFRDHALRQDDFSSQRGEQMNVRDPFE